MNRKNIDRKQQKPNRKVNDGEKDILQIFRFNETNNVYKILSIGINNDKIYIKMQSGTKGDNTKNTIKIILDEKEIIQIGKTLEILYSFINQEKINKLINDINNNSMINDIEISE